MAQVRTEGITWDRMVGLLGKGSLGEDQGVLLLPSANAFGMFL